MEGGMHNHAIDSDLVRRLVRAQHPAWADLPIVPVLPGGNDNRTFRLGDRLSVRMPSASGYVAAVEKEARWLPVIARRVPLPVPEPVAQGVPGEGYPFPWSVNRWMPGTTAEAGPVEDPVAFAVDLAGFLRGLRRVDTSGAPLAGEHSFWRGAELIHYDEETRRTVHELGDRIDGARAIAMWDEALDATWTDEPVWFHGDVSCGNLLVRDGRLSAVIDFGTSGIGDPACDLSIAWTFLDPRARRAFRSTWAPDDGMWARGRAWTLWKALITYAGRMNTDESRGRRVYDEIMADPG
jgi:aminoglycoside phosphotransferase (APT) family kinase protein